MAPNLNIGNELTSGMRAASRGIVDIQADTDANLHFTVNGKISPAIDRLSDEIGSYSQTLQALAASGAAIRTTAETVAETADKGFRDEAMDPIQKALNPQMQRGAWGR